MLQKFRLMAGRWLPYEGWTRSSDSVTVTATGQRRFTLLRMFSILGFLAVAVISSGFGATVSKFLAQEVLRRDALLTSQFVSSIVAAQNQEARLGRKITLGQLLDERANLAQIGVDPKEAANIRSLFYDQIRLLPDVLLANVYALDRKIIWATNPVLIGTFSKGNHELEEAFATGAMVSANYFDQEQHVEGRHKGEQAFTVDPEKFFVESYMPLLNGNSEVVAVVELYKEPASLLDAVQRCRQLVWTCTVLGMIFLYFVMYWLIRRVDRTLADQQRRLIESETLCVIGEMSASVAHGIRNPLATIRLSAELAIDGTPESTRKNAQDIVTEVDHLGKWVRDLLVFSRPVTGEVQTVNLISLIDECLPNFTKQMEKNQIACQFIRPSVTVPRVRGNFALATQVLASVISNAIEAMPKGGSLRLELLVADGEHQVSMVVSDTGSGMSPAQLELVFKPFYTTKRNGLGLGMALVKRIMERFGGAIRLESVEGAGTRVSLTFSRD